MKYFRNTTIFTIGDPELGAIEYVVIFVFFSSGLKCKRNKKTLGISKISPSLKPHPSLSLLQT